MLKIDVSIHAKVTTKHKYYIFTSVSTRRRKCHECLCRFCQQSRGSMNIHLMDWRWNPVHLYKERHAFVIAAASNLGETKRTFHLNLHGNNPNVPLTIVLKSILFASMEEIEEKLQVKVLPFTLHEDQVLIGLCQDHYNTTPGCTQHSCDACKASPLIGQVFNRCCPSHEIVRQHIPEDKWALNYLLRVWYTLNAITINFSYISQGIMSENIYGDFQEKLNNQDLLKRISSLFLNTHSETQTCLS